MFYAVILIKYNYRAKTNPIYEDDKITNSYSVTFSIRFK